MAACRSAGVAKARDEWMDAWMDGLEMTGPLDRQRED